MAPRLRVLGHLTFAAVRMKSSTQTDSKVGAGSGGERRRVLRKILILMACAVADVLSPRAAAADGLLAKLQKRDWKQLAKPLLPSVVALPITELSFPPWLAGTWQVSSTFAGFELPVKKLSKKTLMSDKAIPGFEKLSIVQVPDVGAKGSFTLRFNRRPDGVVVEDKQYNLASMINNALGQKAVEAVTCPSGDRCSIEFGAGATRNAEQIELFYNSRESDLSDDGNIIVYSEYLRQVTYSLSTTMGVARQEVGEYQHFWMFKKQASGYVSGNLLTAAYFNPQDSLFFEAPFSPVVVYSNDLLLRPLDAATDSLEEEEEEQEEAQ
jgi:hypothetical protein